MSDVTLLRKMTGKSPMKFGPYQELRVSDVMCLGFKGRLYLTRAYYDLSNITFVDDVLDELGITNRIEKPGKVSKEEAAQIIAEMSRVSREALKERIGEKAYMGVVQKARRGKRKLQYRGEVVRIQSKANAAAFNHGHRL